MDPVRPEPPASLSGTVVRMHANRFVVQCGERRWSCVVGGRLSRDREDQVRLVAVGDEVVFRPGGEDEGAIERVMPRRNKIARPSVRQRHKEQVIVANVDQLLAVQAARAPDLHLENLDRCLAIAERYGIPRIVVVINKTDLEAEAALEAVRATYAPARYQVLCTSTKDGRGLEEMRTCLAGRTSVLLGPSGAGKSTLINAMVPTAGLKTGVVSEYTEEGRHTTTWVEMLPIPGGGFLIDTPGIEVFGLWEVERGEVAALFPEILPLLGTCKFNDCVHGREPGCAVRAAVESGAIPPTRWESYVRLLAGIPEQRSYRS